MPVFEKRSAMPVPAADLYAWHARPGAFERLAPPWQRLRVLQRPDSLEDGQRLVFEYKVGPVWRRWVAEHHDNVPGEQFADRQIEGPFGAWDHTHRFVAAGGEESVLDDRVVYSLPMGHLLDRPAEGAAGRQLERLFGFRHERARNDLVRHARYAGKGSLTVAVAGASGLLGSSIATFFETGGHRVIRLVRRPPRHAGEAFWDPGRAAGPVLEGVDAMVNFTGESLVGLWTSRKRAAILASRIQPAALLARTAAAMDPPPRVMVSVSGTNAYGDRGDELLTEESTTGDGFLAAVCRQWEQALDPARQAGIRVVTPRLAPVVTGAGGVLSPLLPLFRLGLGGRLGTGAQWMSWVALEDVLGIVQWAIMEEQVEGVVNAVAPHAVTNAQFTRTLGRVLRRPTVSKAPEAAIERVAGDMGRETLLVSLRVLPAKLQEAGFAFLYPDLEGALRFELGRQRH